MRKTREIKQNESRQQAKIKDYTKKNGIAKPNFSGMVALAHITRNIPIFHGVKIFLTLYKHLKILYSLSAHGKGCLEKWQRWKKKHAVESEINM